MHKKIDNLKQLEYLAHFISGSKLTQNWLKLKPKNKEVKTMAEAWTGTCFYVTYLEQELRLYKSVCSEFREDKNNNELENRELKKQIVKLNKQINNLKKITKL
tara:strand:- start:2204 stop:2512 length:309 start_codon:yes stop_codon:yes gene_type:complete